MARKLFNLFGRHGNIKGKWHGVLPALLSIVWLAAVLSGCATAASSGGPIPGGRNGLGGFVYYPIARAPAPTRTVYAPGEDFDIKDSSSQWKGYNYSSGFGSFKASSTITVNGYNKHKLGEQLVTVTCRVAWIWPSEKRLYLNSSDTQTKEYKITVVPVDRITLLELPNKTTYMQGEDFNPAGLLVRVEYEGNAVPEKNIEPPQDHLVLSGYNKNGTGVQTITVDYYGTKTSFDVMVRPN